jgi:hypothetical protein
LTDAEGALFFAVIDFDLPTVKVDLEQVFGAMREVGTPKMGRLAVVDPAALALAIRRGDDDVQAQGEFRAPPCQYTLVMFL